MKVQVQVSERYEKYMVCNTDSGDEIEFDAFDDAFKAFMKELDIEDPDGIDVLTFKVVRTHSTLSVFVKVHDKYVKSSHEFTVSLTNFKSESQVDTVEKAIYDLAKTYEEMT